MSLKYEQTRALLRARDTLRDILQNPSAWKKKRVQEIRDDVYRCLKHFPCLNENGLPIWSQDPFTGKDGERK